MRITVKVKPSAKEEKILETDQRFFSVLVREPPVEGRANKAVCLALSRHFGVPQSFVRVVSGVASRVKIIEIDGVQN